MNQMQVRGSHLQHEHPELSGKSLARIVSSHDAQ